MSDEEDGGAECSKSQFYQLPKYTLKIILYYPLTHLTHNISLVFLKQRLDKKPDIVFRTYRCDKKGDCYGKLSITKLTNFDIEFSVYGYIY